MRARPAKTAPRDSGRVIRDSVGWFRDGTARRSQARRMSRCVECLAPLPSGRREYCSDQCRWRFHGRYFWDAARIVVMRRDRYTCQRCRTRCRRRDLEVDHIVEIARGGRSLDYTNLQTLCRRCHREKTSGFLRSRRGSRTDPAAGAAPADADGVPEWFPA